MSVAGAIRCAFRRPPVALASVLLVVFAAWALASTVQVAQERNAQRSNDQSAREYLCQRVNALPSKLAVLVDLSERRRALLAPTTTRAPRPDLTPEQLAMLEDLNARLEELVADLGRPIDCGLASTGTSTPPTTGARP